MPKRRGFVARLATDSPRPRETGEPESRQRSASPAILRLLGAFCDGPGRKPLPGRQPDPDDAKALQELRSPA